MTIIDLTDDTPAAPPPRPRQRKPAPPRPVTDPEILQHPRCVPVKMTGDQITRLKEKGLLTLDRAYKPAKFRLYCFYEMKDAVSEIPFVAWSKKKSCWIVPISVESLKFLVRLFPSFWMTPDAMRTVGRLKVAYRVENEMMADIEAIKTGKVDVSGIQAAGSLPIWHEQQICVAVIERAWKAGYGVANFSEQGTGKTCVALTCLRRYFKAHPKAVGVVITPKGTFFSTWVREVRTFAPQDVRPVVLQGSIPERGQMALGATMYDWVEDRHEYGMVRTGFTKQSGRPNLFIINHEAGRYRQKDDPTVMNDLFLALGEILESADEHSFLIADELHKFGNPSALQTEAVAWLAERATFFLGQTGTPGLPHKFFSQLKLVDKRIFNISQTDFERRYIQKVGDTTQKVTIGYERLEELQRRASQFSVRFRQEDCLDIPEWTTTETAVEMSAEQRKAYRAIENEIITFYQGHDISKNSLGAKLHGLRNITSGFIKNADGTYVHFRENPKLDKLLELLTDEMVANLNHPEHIRKVVITCQYLEEVALIRKAIAKAALKGGEDQEIFQAAHQGLVVMTSDVTDQGAKKARTEVVTRWVEDPSCRVFLGTEGAFREGLNMVPKLPQVCDVMEMYSSGYSPDSRDQVIKRIIRHGQTRKVRINNLVCEKSIDETIVDALANKLDVCAIVTGDNLRAMMKGRT